MSWLQVFAEADEMCIGPGLYTCDFITATVGADMTELRPTRASDAADASDQVPVSRLVAQQVHAATAAVKDTAEPGALVQELTGKWEEPDPHKPKVPRLWHANSRLHLNAAHRSTQVSSHAISC